MKLNVNNQAAAFQSASYDGHRYVYFVPQVYKLIVRYDTWNAAGNPETTGPDPSGFINKGNYTTLDPTQLNAPGAGNANGLPTITGPGTIANLTGFTGSAIVWDTAHLNEYLYLIPWGNYPYNTGNPVPGSTTARVRVGTQSNPSEPTTWNYVDFTGQEA